MLRSIGALIGLLLIAGLQMGWAADPDQPAFTCPDGAGIDYQIQGEYLGADRDDPDQKNGAQVIALGDGKFDIIGYPGGLPGDGWSRGDQQYRATGLFEGATVKFRASEGNAYGEIKDKTLKVYSGDGTLVGESKRVERKSPTLGANPPEGAIVLFDGTGTDEFVDGKLVDGKYLGATGTYTKRKFGDHQLHIEFRTPFMPKSGGQGRGNSGVYVQSRYELQILDSFGLEGKDNECGGIYSIDQPRVNACYPPLAWQTYDIDFTSARYDDEGKKTKNGRVTIRHNGIVIHDDLELKHDTPGRFQEGPGPESLYLQDHGNPVVFRNIWVLQK